MSEGNISLPGLPLAKQVNTTASTSLACWQTWQDMIDSLMLLQARALHTKDIVVDLSVHVSKWWLQACQSAPQIGTYRVLHEGDDLAIEPATLLD